MSLKRKILVSTLGLLLVVITTLLIMFVVKRYTKAEGAVDTGGLPSLEDISFLEGIVSGTKTLYGIDASEYNVESAEIDGGMTFSKLLNQKYNVNIAIVNQLIEMCKGKFDLRDIRAGQPYAAFISEDSTSTTLHYLVYEKNRTEFITFATGDSVYVDVQKKDVVTEEKYAEGVIESSLYATMQKNGLSPMLAVRLSEIFKYTIDFFAIQKGDSFRVLFEQQFIDTTAIGIGKIYGAEFTHNGVPYLGIRFEQGEEIGYWDAKGVNMRKSFLRAPLSFQARVSSRFGMRIHPIKRVRRQHNGIDYAAPTGTPVLSVADGTVIMRGWDRGGGGNTLWIRHAQGLESGYLHLSRFASGLSVGSRVRQGQVVAYVGSTGGSTGPHLDFRIKQNSKYINPEKLPTVPTAPISGANKERFNKMMKDVTSVMDEYRNDNK